MTNYAAFELSVIAVEAMTRDVRAFLMEVRLVAVVASLGEECEATTACRSRVDGVGTDSELIAPISAGLGGDVSETGAFAAEAEQAAVSLMQIKR